MSKQAGDKPGLSFRFLPAYAAFLLSEKLEEFALATLDISRELEMPLLKFFESLPEGQLTAISIESSRKLLIALSENKASEFLAEGLATWKENRLPLIQGDDIVIEDVTKGNFIRRKVFRDFLPTYTDDPRVLVNVMGEVDQFTQANEEVSYKTLFEMKERKIREHHHLLDKINNASPGIIYVYEPKTHRRIYSNNKGEELLGYNREDLESFGTNTIGALVHAADRELILEHRRRMLEAADAETRPLEYRILNKDGRYVWIRAYESVFRRNDEGLPVEVIGIALDITQEKEAVLQLAQREQQLREAQELAGMGSFEWDLEHNTASFSPQLYQIFEAEEGIDIQQLVKFIHPADREQVRQAVANAIEGQGDYEIEYRYRRHAAEKVVWSRGKVVFDEGKAVRVKGTVMDVTQRHDMLKKLARSEQLHKQAQGLTHLGNWSWSLTDDKVEWSDEMYRIFGLEPQSEAMTFSRFENFIHPDDREPLREALNKAISVGYAEDYLMRVLNKEGAVRYIEGKSEILRDENDVTYKIVGTCQDITDHYLLNEQLKATAAELEEQRNQLMIQNRALERSNQELTTFNYISSHDLKEPVRKIKIFSNLITTNPAEPLTQQQADTMSRIVAAANHMDRLIEALIVFSRTNAGERRFTELDLKDVLAEVALVLKEQIEESGAVIYADPLPVIEAIPFQIQQLFENIIANAIKYRKPGVRPEIKIRERVLKGKEIGAEVINPNALFHEISVTDNGIGFDQQYAAKVFEVFQRLHNKDSYSGTGIGLAICKKIVQNHDGYITAESTPAQGASFKIYLPVLNPDVSGK